MVTSTIQPLMPSRLILRMKLRGTSPTTNGVNTNPLKLSDTKMAFLRLTFSILSCILCWIFLIAADRYALHFNDPEFSLATMSRRDWELTVVVGVGWGCLLLVSLLSLLILMDDWKADRTPVQAKHLLIIFVMTMVLATPLVGLLIETKAGLRTGWMVIALFITSQISCFLTILVSDAFDMWQFTWNTGSWTVILIAGCEFLSIAAIRSHAPTGKELEVFTLSDSVFGTVLGLFVILCIVLDAHFMLHDRWSVLSIFFRFARGQHWMEVVVLPCFSKDNNEKQPSSVNTLDEPKK